MRTRPDPSMAGSGGLGRLEEDLMVHQLLPGIAEKRGFDPLNPRATDIRSLQIKPYYGVITEDILRGLLD